MIGLLKQHFFEGGPAFMTLYYIMWLLIIFFVVRFLIGYFSDSRDMKKLDKIKSSIFFIGTFVFLFSIFYHTLGIYGALSAIEVAHDISPAMIVGGFRVSLIAPLYSFFMFLISFLIWFVFGNLIKQ